MNENTVSVSAGHGCGGCGRWRWGRAWCDGLVAGGLRRGLASNRFRCQFPARTRAGAGRSRPLHARPRAPGLRVTRAPSSPNPGAAHVFPRVAIEGANLSSPGFQSAQNACQHLLPQGTPPTGAELHQQFISALKSARCPWNRMPTGRTSGPR